MKKIFSIILILILLIGLSACVKNSNWHDKIKLDLNDYSNLDTVTGYITNISNKSISKVTVTLEFEYKGSKWTDSSSVYRLDAGQKSVIVFDSKSNFDDYIIKDVIFN